MHYIRVWYHRFSSSYIIRPASMSHILACRKCSEELMCKCAVVHHAPFLPYPNT